MPIRSLPLPLDGTDADAGGRQAMGLWREAKRAKGAQDAGPRARQGQGRGPRRAAQGGTGRVWAYGLVGVGARATATWQLAAGSTPGKRAAGIARGAHGLGPWGLGEA